MQGDRIGRRMPQRPLAVMRADAEGPEGGCPVARDLPDLAGEVGDRGLAVCPGDAGHDRRLGAVVARSREREAVPGIGVGHETDPARETLLGPLRREHGNRPALHGIGDVVDARSLGAGERRKQVAGAHVARIGREPSDRHIDRRLGRSGQRDA